MSCMTLKISLISWHNAFKLLKGLFLEVPISISLMLVYGVLFVRYIFCVIVHNWERAWASPTFDCSAKVRLTVCPCVRLSGWNIMGMHSKRNTWLSCTVLLRMLNIMQLEWQTWIDSRARAWKGSKQRTCRRREHNRQPARQRRQRQGPGARESIARSTSKESSRRKQTACT